MEMITIDPQFDYFNQIRENLSGYWDIEIRNNLSRLIKDVGNVKNENFPVFLQYYRIVTQFIISSTEPDEIYENYPSKDGWKGYHADNKKYALKPIIFTTIPINQGHKSEALYDFELCGDPFYIVERFFSDQDFELLFAMHITLVNYSTSNYLPFLKYQLKENFDNNLGQLKIFLEIIKQRFQIQYAIISEEIMIKMRGAIDVLSQKKMKLKGDNEAVVNEGAKEDNKKEAKKGRPKGLEPDKLHALIIRFSNLLDYLDINNRNKAYLAERIIGKGSATLKNASGRSTYKHLFNDYKRMDNIYDYLEEVKEIFMDIDFDKGVENVNKAITNLNKS